MHASGDPLRSVALEPLDVRHVARLRELHQQPGVLKWWGPMEHGFPFDEPESQRFAVVTGGEIVGLIQWGDDSYEETRHAYVDIFVGDDYAGRGIGTEAMRLMTQQLIEHHGYHRITRSGNPLLRKGGLPARGDLPPFLSGALLEAMA